MSARTYARTLVAIGLANYLLIPAAMTLADAFGLVPAVAEAAYVPPATALAVAMAVAIAAWRRTAETGTSRLWTLPLLLWVATAGAFRASAPLSIMAMVASGHATAGLDMLSQAAAPLCAMVYVGLYRPPSQRWLGQRLVTVAVALAVIFDFVAGAPRMLGVLGGWANFLAMAHPEFGHVGGWLMAAAFALEPATGPLQSLDQVAGLPMGVHGLVLVGGLVALAAEGDWRPERRGGIGELSILPPADRR